MLPQELIQMAANRMIVLKAGMPPVRGDKIVYWRERAFKRRLRAAPVVPAQPVAEKTSVAVPSTPTGAKSSTPDPLTLHLDPAALPEGLPPLRDNASAAEVEAWVEHFIDASAQPREVSHAR
jgi:type IV secretion system protein VirD4